MPNASWAQGGRQRYIYMVAAPTVAAVLVTALIITLMLIWSARSANDVAFDRQEKLAALILRQSITQIPFDQESTTVWDDPVVKLREPTLDMTWLDENMGVWLHDYFDHDQVYILDSANRPVYAMRDGARAAEEVLHGLRAGGRRGPEVLRELRRPGRLGGSSLPVTSRDEQA